MRIHVYNKNMCQIFLFIHASSGIFKILHAQEHFHLNLYVLARCDIIFPMLIKNILLRHIYRQNDSYLFLHTYEYKHWW